MENLLQELDVYRRQILEGVSAEELDRKQKEKVYDLAKNGKRALLIKYDEPEGKEKLPFEIAVL